MTLWNYLDDPVQSAWWQQWFLHSNQVWSWSWLELLWGTLVLSWTSRSCCSGRGKGGVCVRRATSGNHVWDDRLGATKIRVSASSCTFLMTLPKMGTGGNVYSWRFSHETDIASTAQASGSSTGETYSGSQWLNCVANRSTMGWNHTFHTCCNVALCRVHSVWRILSERLRASTTMFSLPGMCLAEREIL